MFNIDNVLYKVPIQYNRHWYVNVLFVHVSQTSMFYAQYIKAQQYITTYIIKASAHSFKQFTSRLLKSTFSLSLCTYITRLDVMLDFICMGPVDLPGARRKRRNTKWKVPCPQWDSNPQPFDSKSDALPTELAGLGECYPFKSPYYIHVLPILMYTLL